LLLELGEDCMDGGFESFDVAKEVVVQSGSFEVAPKTFDQVPFRAVARPPYHQDMIAMLVEQFQDSRRSMVTGVIQNVENLANALSGESP